MLLVLTALMTEGDNVVRWNRAMVDAIRSEQTSTVQAAHQLALMHVLCIMRQLPNLLMPPRLKMQRQKEWHPLCTQNTQRTFKQF